MACLAALFVTTPLLFLSSLLLSQLALVGAALLAVTGAVRRAAGQRWLCARRRVTVDGKSP